ncbi:MAG: metallophosphoesterase [Clostridiales bacterium]|nr:metallophosphoesterase [Clostridiales bacterium]
MRILVLSDTHGDLNSAIRAVDSQPTAEIIVHCGDGADQAMYLKDNYRDKMIVAVRGNCDWCSPLPPTETLNVCGKRIFVTHGHLYGVKSGLYNVMSIAGDRKADILLFGHTHIPLCKYEDGLYMLNPGSCHGYMASYGYIDITPKGEIVTNTVALT